MTLHLVLDYKWFDMIATGVKLEEYREMTDYWKKRIWDRRGEIDSVCFHRGYTSITITKRVFAIVEDAGREEWGAEPLTLYYVIKLTTGGDEPTYHKSLSAIKNTEND